MGVMSEAISRVIQDEEEVTGPNVRAALEEMEDYETGGITSPLTFSPDDHAGNKALVMYQVQDSEWTPVTDYISVD